MLNMGANVSFLYHFPPPFFQSSSEFCLVGSLILLLWKIAFVHKVTKPDKLKYIAGHIELCLFWRVEKGAELKT